MALKRPFPAAPFSPGRMPGAAPPRRLSAASDILRGWKRSVGLESDRMVVLNAVWEKEAGHLSRFWSLEGVRRNTLFVKVRSPAAAQELHFRGAQLIKSLNKYFKRAWIKGIRALPS
mgnify:CR=1 FL=1